MRSGTKRCSDVRIVKLGYWEFITEATESILFPEGLQSWELEHAAVMETSVMMRIHPDLVRSDRIPDDPAAQFPPYDVYPSDTRSIPSTGVLSSAKSATREKGDAVLEQIVSDIATALAQAFFARM